MRGADVKLRLHPLFLAAGAVSALTGDLLLFLAATLAALEHECAHAFAARRFGYRLDRIVLMPYGAVISGDIAGIPPGEEIAVCLAGPLANAVTALAFAALWWLFPETYPYTDVAARVSLSLFLVNLLPAFPLDGGRLLRLALLRFGQARARAVCRAVTLAVSAGILAYFIATCFGEPNFGALLFSALLAAGAFGGGSYARLTFTHGKNFARGVEERRIAVEAGMAAGRAVRFLREDKYLVLVLFEEREFVGEVTEDELLRELEAGNYEKPLKAI